MKSFIQVLIVFCCFSVIMAVVMTVIPELLGILSLIWFMMMVYLVFSGENQGGKRK